MSKWIADQEIREDSDSECGGRHRATQITITLPVPRIEWHPPRKREPYERILHILHEMRQRGHVVYWAEQSPAGDRVIVITAASYWEPV